MAQFTDPSTGNDTVTGTDLADTFIWRGGNDTYDGGAGEDTLIVSRDDLAQWQVNGTSVSAAGTGGPISISTASVEVFEFVEPAIIDELGFSVVFIESSDISVATRGTTGTAYTVFGSLTGDHTLIARGLGSDVALRTPTVSLIGGGGDDIFKVELDSGGVYILGATGTDRLVVNALRDDVEVLVNTPLPNTITLKWDDTVAQFQSDVEEIEFANIAADGNPLVLSYAELAATTIFGTDAAEVITDGAGNNRIEAGGGNDWINMIGGIDVVDGGAGTDMLSFVGRITGAVGVYSNLTEGSFYSGRTQIVSASNIENVTGTSGIDTFIGDDGANWFRGFGGSDSFYASAGGDLINGGGGSDGFFSGDDDDNISLLRGRVWDGEGTGTRLSSIEWVFGGDGDDTITGDHGGNALYGDNGDDVLMGNGGDDQIYGGAGTDVAVFGYAQDQYDIVRGTNPFGTFVTVEYTGIGAGDGFDTISSVEILRFADGDMIL